MPAKKTPPSREEIIAMKNTEENISLDKLSSKLGTTRKLLRKWMNDYDLHFEPAKIISPLKIEIPPKEELEKTYNTFGSSLSSIGRHYDVSHQTVGNWLIKYNIPLKGHEVTSQEANAAKAVKKPDGKLLYKLYAVDNMSIAQLNNFFHTNQTTVYSWLEEYNIPLRTLSESCFIAKERQYADKQISKEELEPVCKKFKNLEETAKYFDISRSHCRKLIQGYGIDIPKSFRSIAEKSLFEYCNELRPDVKWENSKRKFIHNRELDIFCQELNLAIEYNGLYFHSEDNKVSPKYKKYHQEKYNMCKEKGIELITIFESDDVEKVKSFLRHKLGKTPNKIYARNTEIRKIESSRAREFHEKYHLNNYVGSNTSYGLFYNNELIQVASFGVPRFNTRYEWECTRSSSHSEYSVVGGVSKLFKTFINENNVASLITYADLRYGSGKVYEKCGMKFVKQTGPNYWYFHPKAVSLGIESRVKYQKYKLKKLLPIYDDALSEWDNMRINGYDRIWDCGNNIYEYTDQ